MKRSHEDVTPQQSDNKNSELVQIEREVKEFRQLIPDIKHLWNNGRKRINWSKAELTNFFICYPFELEQSRACSNKRKYRKISQ